MIDLTGKIVYGPSGGKFKVIAGPYLAQGSQKLLVQSQEGENAGQMSTRRADMFKLPI